MRSSCGNTPRLLQPALGTPEGTIALALGNAASRRHDRVARRSADFGLRRRLVPSGARHAWRRSLPPANANAIFAADVAHELRSPLAAIASVAQAARTSAAPDSRDAFDAIAADALDASAIVTALLTLARDPGHRALQCEPVDLAAIVARCASDAAERARAGGVQHREFAGERDRRRRRAPAARTDAKLARKRGPSRAHAGSRRLAAKWPNLQDRRRRRRRRNSRRRSRARFRTLLPS